MTDMIKSPEWSARHRRTIGSSIAAAVCGVNPYVTAAQAFDYMTGAAPPAEINPHIERGVLLEPIARRKLSEHLKVRIEPHDQDTFLLSEKYPFAHALPDGWIMDAAMTTEWPVELKVPTPQNWQRIRLQGVHDYWLVQCQHILAVTDAPHLEFGALNPVNMQVLAIHVVRDDALIASIMEREAAFFEQVRSGKRPEEAPPAPIDMPEIGGEMVTLTGDEALAAAAAYVEADEILKEAEALKESAKARIGQLMGNAQIAELPGLRVYRRIQEGRLTFDKTALAREHPELDLSRYEKRGKPFETFRAYRLK